MAKGMKIIITIVYKDYWYENSAVILFQNK